MSDQSTQSITVDAPAAEVMAVIADFDAYPQWAKGVTKAERVAGIMQMARSAMAKFAAVGLSEGLHAELAGAGALEVETPRHEEGEP